MAYQSQKLQLSKSVSSTLDVELEFCKWLQELGLNDIVRTGLDDAAHSKSAVLHTFLGNKYVVQSGRGVRCTSAFE